MADRPPGQTEALADLYALEADSNSAIEVVRVAEPDGVDEAMLVDLSIDCRGFEQAGRGLNLRSRERFWLHIDEDFPLSPPSIFAHDTRFAFSDHVYWMGKLGVYLCVYYSIEHQWHPEQGVLGFAHAFMHWLENAAAGTLDIAAQPQHPPQLTGERADQFFVARADTPAFDGAWLGYAVLQSRTADRFDIVDWTKDWREHGEHTLAPAILIDSPFVSEFPRYVSSLLLFLDKLGIDSELLASRLLVHARHTRKRPPMFLVFGVAMRGTAAERAQHLVVWRIDDRGANDLRNIARQRKRHTDKSAKAAVNKGTAVIERWKESTGALHYCAVYEDRSRVVKRRDGASGAAWFLGRTVTLWGVGALGSPIAEHLVRAGIVELRIVDWGRVTPGLLVRQNYRDRDIGSFKVAALQQRLMQINPAVKVIPYAKNLLRGGDWFAETFLESNVLIDATASRRVALITDRFLRDKGPLLLPLTTVANDAEATRALVTITPARSLLGPSDLLHRSFLRLIDAKEGEEWLEAFWPVVDENQWFEPEPGCSSPTFRGSNADAGALAGGMLSIIGQELLKPTSELAIFATGMNIETQSKQRLAFSAGEHQLCPDTGYEVRFLPEAAAAMQGIIDAEQQGGKASLETGGVLYGFRDEFLRVAWVVDASPPPPDSRRSRNEFLCGVEGVAAADEAWRERSSGKICFLGTWHSHPVSAATPSVVDLDAMEALLQQSGSPRHRLLLVIVGYSATTPSIGSYVFGGRRPQEEVLRSADSVRGKANENR